MQIDRVRRTALVVVVLGAVTLMAASTATTPLTADTSVLNGTAGASGATGASGPTGATGSTSLFGATGATGTTGTSGTTGATGATGPTGGAGASGTSAAGSAGSTTTPGATTTVGATGATTPGATSGAGAGSGNSGTNPGAFTVPVITGSQPQPQSGTGGAGAPPAGKHSAHGGSGEPSGPTAPSPSLFAGTNPLAGVLPGSWEDPFIVNGAADVPQFYVESFHIPPFLLAIYQAAGAAYGIPWQTLAAINEVETDYGTDLDVSSAGAIGWMQFLPSTWKRFGVDASASGVRDPYNAADAIFAAARYLAAAGAKHNLARAIFAYNHSHAYVQSVMLRAELLSGEPSALVDSVTELAEGDFPIQLRYHASYGPASSSRNAGAANGSPAKAGAAGIAPAPAAVGAATAASQRTPGEKIFASSHAAVVAAQDGTVIAIGRSRRLGRYVVLRNAFGDRFTYGNLASVSAWYPTPKPARRSAALLSAAAPAALAPGPHPTAPASAGAQSSRTELSGKLFRGALTSTTSSPAPAPVVPTINLRSRPSAVTLFTPLVVLERATRATLTRAARHSLLARYFTGAFGLHPSQLELRRMTVGSHVLAGTILGRLARTKGAHRAHLIFELRPAGRGEAPVDPRPFLDAWSQLETLELHRDSFNSPFYGPNLHATSVGTVLVSSQVDIERIVLQDTHVTLPACERAAIVAGNVDRRVLAALEVLVIHGISPTVNGSWCASGAHRQASPAILKTGDAIALSALAGRPSGPLASVAIKALDALHGASRPRLSERTVPGQLVISYPPTQSARALAAAASYTAGYALSAARWAQLDTRLQQIAEPRVPTAVSAEALRVGVHHARARTSKRH